MTKGRFADLHPALQCLIYGVLLSSTLILEHPASLILAWLGVCLSLRPISSEGLKKGLLTILLPFFFAVPAALLNALFRHYGMIRLFMLYRGGWVTLESLADGAQAGVRLGLAFLWFKHLYQYMETDRLLYLFSRFPSFALLLTLVLRFLPRFAKEAGELRAYRSLFSRGTKPPLRRRFEEQSSLLAGLSGWGLESSIRAADAMLARGLHLPGRKSRYQLYRWRREDTFWLSAFLLLCGFSLYLLGQGCLKTSFFPFLYMPAWTPSDTAAFILTGLIACLPFIIDLGGAVRWTLSKRNI